MQCVTRPTAEGKAAGKDKTMNRQEFSTGKLHASRVLNELCSLRYLEALCDGLVKLSDGSVKVSKAVLASGCPYFRCVSVSVCVFRK